MRKVLGPFAARWRWLEIAVRIQERFSETHGGYLGSAVTLASFLSLFPLLLVAVAVVGWFSAASADLPGQVIGRLGLSGEAATAVTSAIEQAENSKAKAGLVGFAGLLWSSLGLVSALQFSIDAVWQVKTRGWKDKIFGLAWLVGAGILFAASAAATAVLNFLPAAFAPLNVLLGLAVGVVLWLWTLHTLGNRDVGWKPLLPGALLGAVGFEVLKVVGAIYVPRAVASSSALYGSIGVVFAILAWLFFFGRLVVYASVTNVVLYENERGTVKTEIEIPKVPGAVPVEATRSGEAIDIRDKDDGRASATPGSPAPA